MNAKEFLALVEKVDQEMSVINDYARGGNARLAIALDAIRGPLEQVLAEAKALAYDEEHS
jgi:hypothetical protein